MSAPPPKILSARLMPLELQVVATGHAGRGADGGRGRWMLLDFISAFPCGLSAVEVEAAAYDDERECQSEKGWLAAEEGWQFGDGLLELAMENVSVNVWQVAWREEQITNAQVVEDGDFTFRCRRCVWSGWKASRAISRSRQTPKRRAC